MRLTVGPLPPAVYWRRRAVVLGAGLLFLIVLLYSCNETDRKTGVSGTGATPSATAAPQPTGSVLTPQSGNPRTPSAGESGGAPDGGRSSAPADGGIPSNDSGGLPAAPVAGDGACADTEIKVTPVAAPSTAQRGTLVTLRLKVKNVSDRTCSRDVGADLQELFIKTGAAKVWSSDTCGTGKGSDVQSFTPGFERSYELQWNGRESTKCASGVAGGDVAPAGTYQLFARVGTKLSEPVQLTLTN